MRQYLSTALLCALPVLCTVLLLVREGAYREALRVPPAPLPAPVVSRGERLPFKPQAIAAVLGMTPQGALVQSAEPLQLRASFSNQNGLSRALLASTTGNTAARFYSVGETLPGGSVLRRIEASHVVLWRNGRQERLAISPASVHLLPTRTAQPPQAPPSSLHLKPVAGKP